MRIKRPSFSPDVARRHKADIAQAAGAYGVAGRVCGDACTITCERCGSTACQCKCSPHCPDAIRALSSDPQRHPIEQGIVGLVFALTRVGLFTPCWSCEGHTSPDGSLWKMPTVWFTCDATAHVRLLATGVAKLTNTKRLSTQWRVVVTYSDPDNPCTTFALEPAQTVETPDLLAKLQGDADVIAHALQGMIINEGRELRQAAKY
jgi:hypothetical protein